MDFFADLIIWVFRVVFVLSVIGVCAAWLDLLGRSA